VLTAIVDDLEVQFVPRISRKQMLEVLLGLADILSSSKTPALSQSMDVRIHRE
jgi:hypothetical protein